MLTDDPDYNPLMPETTDKAICFLVDRPITREGYEIAGRYMEDFLARNGELRILAYFVDHAGWDAEAAKSDMDFSLRYGSKLRKYAAVNPTEQIITRSKFKKPLHPQAEVRFFETSELQEAVRWINE